MMFWLWASLLVCIAFVFVAWPLLIRSKHDAITISRKASNIALFNEHLRELDESLKHSNIDDDQYQTQKKELENNLWNDVQLNEVIIDSSSKRRWLLALSISIPLCAFILYSLWGSSHQVALSKAIERSVMATSKEDRQAAHEKVINLLEDSTQANPNNFDSWYLLGEFYVQTKQYKKAANAFGHAVSIQAGNADALAQYAQALYFAENNKLTFAVTSTVEQALKIDPEQPTALGLMGIAAFENKHYQDAIGYWQKILLIVGEQDAGASSLKNGINFAKSLLQKQGQWASVDVHVTIDPSVLVTPSQWLLVYARQPTEKKPVAIVRLKAVDLPETITLDDTTTMPNGALLSSVKNIEVVARLSETGSAIPSEADKQAISAVVSPSTKGTQVKLLIK